MLRRFSHVWFFATLWIVAHQSPLSMGFSRQEYWSGLPCSPPGDLPDPGIKPTSFMSLALAGGFFTISTTWEAHKSTIFQCKIKIKLKIKKKESRARSRFEEWNLPSSLHFLALALQGGSSCCTFEALSPLTHCSQGRHTLLWLMRTDTPWFISQSWPGHDGEGQYLGTVHPFAQLWAFTLSMEPPGF